MKLCQSSTVCFLAKLPGDKIPIMSVNKAGRTEEEQLERNRKTGDAIRARYASMTNEEMASRNQKIKDSWTPEMRAIAVERSRKIAAEEDPQKVADRGRKISAAAKKRYETMSHERREEINLAISDGAKQLFASLTDEQRSDLIKKRQVGLNTAEAVEKSRQGRIQWWQKHPDARKKRSEDYIAKAKVKAGLSPDTPDYTEVDHGFFTPCHDYWRPSRTPYQKAWVALYGPIKGSGYVLHHLCENQRCVRVSHLIPITEAEHRREHARLHIEWKEKAIALEQEVRELKAQLARLQT
jgi:hypothetical protein